MEPTLAGVAAPLPSPEPTKGVEDEEDAGDLEGVASTASAGSTYHVVVVNRNATGELAPVKVDFTCKTMTKAEFEHVVRNVADFKRVARLVAAAVYDEIASGAQQRAASLVQNAAAAYPRQVDCLLKRTGAFRGPQFDHPLVAPFVQRLMEAKDVELFLSVAPALAGEPLVIQAKVLAAKSVWHMASKTQNTVVNEYAGVFRTFLNADGELPSGTTIEEVLAKVLDALFAKEKGADAVRPAGWEPMEWLAFLCFGEAARFLGGRPLPTFSQPGKDCDEQRVGRAESRKSEREASAVSHISKAMAASAEVSRQTGERLAHALEKSAAVAERSAVAAERRALLDKLLECKLKAVAAQTDQERAIYDEHIAMLTTELANCVPTSAAGGAAHGAATSSSGAARGAATSSSAAGFRDTPTPPVAGANSSDDSGDALDCDDDSDGDGGGADATGPSNTPKRRRLTKAEQDQMVSTLVANNIPVPTPRNRANLEKALKKVPGAAATAAAV